jgi:hypothetical protein
MRSAIAIALMAGTLSLTGTANAGVATSIPGTAADSLTTVDQVQFLIGGRRHCWYADGWHGPGWYWCGYRLRRGLGWGGGEGFHGWHHR